MKNGSISDQLNMQERQLSGEKKMNTSMQPVMYADKLGDMLENKFANYQDDNLSNKIENNQSVNQENKQDSSLTDLGLSSVFSILPSVMDVNQVDEQQPLKPKKKKKKKQRPRFRR
jgi:hypothetical protein